MVTQRAIASMSVKRLLRVRDMIDEQLRVVELAKVKKQITRNMGPRAPRSSMTPVLIRYRHPDDPLKTWTGIGRRPQWLRLWEDGYGVSREAFRIPGTDVPRMEPLPVRYRHPDDPTKTWTGVGRRPIWMKEMEEQGISRERFRVPGSDIPQGL